MPEPQAPEKWYADGLHFKCTQCGNCCTGAPGYVYVTADEIRSIAELLGRADGKLTRSELRRVGARHSLTERENGDCVFLKDEKGRRVCGIYSARPLQCRTWPFWDYNLESRDTWEAAACGCPGINHGPRHTLVQIEIRRTARTWADAES